MIYLQSPQQSAPIRRKYVHTEQLCVFEKCFPVLNTLTYTVQLIRLPQDSDTIIEKICIPVGSPWGILSPLSTRWILQDQMNVRLFDNVTCHCEEKRQVRHSSMEVNKTRKTNRRWTEQRGWTKSGVHKNNKVIKEKACASKNETGGYIVWGTNVFVFPPVICWDRTSVKSGLKLPPSNTSHPSAAMRPAITGALPPTAHLFPGKSREASTSSLNRVSFSIKRLQDKEKWSKNCKTENTKVGNQFLYYILICSFLY